MESDVSIPGDLCASAAALAAEEIAPLGQDDECSESGCAVNALQSKATLRSGESCHDAVPGDACYKDIMWAKHTGIRQHPHWYRGLTSHSSNADFQEIVHSHSPNKCAMPCKKTTGCHTAQKGESCYNDIMWAKNTGIRQHAHWYPGLSPSSSDAEFQASIHAKRPDKCPEPCPEPAAAAPVEPEPEPVIPPQTPELQPPAAEPQPPAEPEPAAQPTEQPAAQPTEQPAAEEPAPAPQPEHHPAPAPAPEVNRYPQCPRMPQAAREACEQEAIQQEQREREEAERAEQEADRQHERETPLDIRHQEIIDEIGGEPTVDGIPDFDDPDS